MSPIRLQYKGDSRLSLNDHLMGTGSGSEPINSVAVDRCDPAVDGSAGNRSRRTSAAAERLHGFQIREVTQHFITALLFKQQL